LSTVITVASHILRFSDFGIPSDALAYLLAADIVVLHFCSSSPQTLSMSVALAVPVYSSF